MNVCTCGERELLCLSERNIFPLFNLAETDLPKSDEEKKQIQKLPIRNVIGKLWWVALQTRSDIFCALHKCALWQNKQSNKLWRYLLHILKYLRATRDFGLVFRREKVLL